jgi:hypothetical protein
VFSRAAPRMEMKKNIVSSAGNQTASSALTDPSRRIPGMYIPFKQQQTLRNDINVVCKANAAFSQADNIN